MKKLKLQTKITLMNIAVIFVSLIITTAVIARFRISSIKKEIEVSIMNTAQITAHSPIVINSLLNKRTAEDVQKYIETILKNTEKIDILVVADINGKRYAHPDFHKVGLYFVGGDEKRVIKKGENYISEAVGTLGRQLRAFVPVVDNNGNQLGFVMASTLTKSIEKEKVEAISTVIFISLLGFIIGIIGAVLLSQSIKNTLLGFEPEQITKLYIQKKEVLNAMSEGIIAVDENLKVTHLNNKAIEMLDIKNENVIGNNILNVIPNSRLPMVMEKGEAEYNKEMSIEEAIIVGSRIPIKEGKKILGAVAIFRDKTEVTRLAEEITGVKQVVEALRANTHEFMNKLHVVLGLIQINEIEEAKKYIINQSREQQQKISRVVKKIEEPTIAALMLGKISRAKERGIDLYLDAESVLKKRGGKISSSAFITIIGNLIENSIEALNLSNNDNKIINVLIKEMKNKIVICVSDTGIGIKQENLSQIYVRGFSTKEGNRGRGLSIVAETVENLNGKIEMSSQIGSGTKFTITIPKEE
ncbi:ATP-binding protein [Clostridium aestuarii]|uniref:histidine kinase n=1 Tax=Clostridium aestuarii TaxID=338193 RepID=A0ABT4D3E7_9CLOT|nr:ATP-binding protein [Clostridium aestuarii]MCY6485167.1 ATP-binding protein [Clostridium aestuarii]